MAIGRLIRMGMRGSALIIAGMASLAALPPAHGAEVREDCALAPTPPFMSPREAKPGCLLDAVRDSGILSTREGRFVAEFTVCQDGAVGRFRLVELGGATVPSEVASAVWTAVKGCEWKPGLPRSDVTASRLGAPISAIHSVSLDAAVGKVTARPPAPDCGVRAPAVPVGTAGHKPPRQAVPNCLAHSIQTPTRLKGIITAFFVRLRVGADGCIGEVAVDDALEPTTFQAMAEQAARSCAWSPGTGPDGQPEDAMYFTQVHLTGG